MSTHLSGRSLFDDAALFAFSTCSGRLFESFMVTSITSSSLSTEVAMTLPSPDESASDTFVTIRSESTFSLFASSSDVSTANAGWVVRLPTNSKIFRRMMSSLRALRLLASMSDSYYKMNTYFSWGDDNEMRDWNMLPFLVAKLVLLKPPMIYRN